MKLYIGDGVYVRSGRYKGEVVIYTSDGVAETNKVFIEPALIDILAHSIKRISKEEK
tara:strand:+ start:965 stop:1135 length:171 start_codon:yes stop_codon:yes gene_type:complete